jgi:hypothetical protein
MVVGGATLQDNNAYSLKVTGAVVERSVLDLAPVDRWIAPDTFLRDLARGVTIQHAEPLVKADLLGRSKNSVPVLSTIPMPALMKLVGWPTVPDFRFVRIGSLTVTLTEPNVDVFQTIYYPWHAAYYRASLTSNRLIIEFIDIDDAGLGDWPAPHARFITEVAEDFGLDPDGIEWEGAPRYQVQQYGKLLPIPERERRAFILAMTDEYGLYSVGRFATWRQLLLDDVVEDVRVVEAMIGARDDYARQRLRV